MIHLLLPTHSPRRVTRLSKRLGTKLLLGLGLWLGIITWASAQWQDTGPVTAFTQDVYSRDANTGFAAGGDGTILETVKGGAEWIRQNNLLAGGGYVSASTTAPANLFFIAAGESKTIGVTSNTSWRASCSQPWLTLNAAQGNGNGTLTVTAAANPTAQDRTATITINEGSIVRTVQVKQAALGPIYLTVSPKELLFPVAGEDKTFAISSNGAWTITPDASWTGVFTMISGSGDNTITVTGAANDMAYSRQGTIQVKSDTLTQTIYISQPAGEPKVTLSVTELAFGHKEDHKFPSIYTNVNLISTSDQDWMVANEGWEVGLLPMESYCGVYVQANPTPYPRTGTITFVDQVSFSVKTIRVTQAAAPPTLELSANALSFNSGSETGSIEILSNSSWSVWVEGDITENAQWLYLNLTGGQGDATLHISALPNKSMKPRTGILYVSTEFGMVDTVTVTQYGSPAYVVTRPPSVTIGAPGGSRTITVGSNTSWHITSRDPWLSFSPSSGSGDTTIIITAAPNAGTSVRTGLIAIATDGAEDSSFVYVNQQRFTVSPETVSFIAAGESKTLHLVAPNTNWTATASQPWLSVNKASGRGSDTLVVTAGANSTPASRTASLTITAGSLSRTVTFSQATAAPCNNQVAFVSNPSNGATITGTTLYLNTVPGATSYTVEVNTAADFTGTALVRTTSSRLSSGIYFAGFPEMTFGQQYFVRVKTNLSDCYGPARHFFTAPLESFSYVSNPSNGATITGTNLYLNTVPGATSYTVEVNTAADFTGTALVRTTSSRLSSGIYFVGFPEMALGQQYYARVKTNLSANWGRVTAFATANLESFSYVSNPSNGATITGTNLYLNTVPGATSYTVEVNTAADFTGTALVRTTSSRLSTGTYYASFPELAAGQKYFARVKTNLSAKWGITTSFTRAAATARVARGPQVEAAPEPSTLRAYPNPFRDRLTLHTSLQGALRIELLDGLGRAVYRSLAHAGPDAGPLDLAAPEAKPGVYFLRISAPDGRQQVMRLVKE